MNYADSHDILRVSAKRFEVSPYAPNYAHENTLYGIYCGRLYALSLGEDPAEFYWKLRREVLLYDVPEKPLDIKGPDAVTLLERVLTRTVDDLKLWRARYALACTPRGGILMDGVLMRLAADHFWFVQADGEFESWLLAHAEDLDVTISDPRSRVLQIQGPAAPAVLQGAANTAVNELGYFHVARMDLGGQRLLVSRSGWTGELGYEIYSNGADTDHTALWDHLMRHGEPHGMAPSSAESMGIRRIEAGILDNGTDMDPSMTPYEAGLGRFVDFENHKFVGRKALLGAERQRLLYGLTCDHATPFAGSEVMAAGESVGHVTTGAWTPYLKCGIGFVRFHQSGEWTGQSLRLRAGDDEMYECRIVALPFYDPEKKIARGLQL